MRESNASLSVDRTASSAFMPLDEALGLRCDRGVPKLREERVLVALGNVVPELGNVVRARGGGGEDGGGYRRVGAGGESLMLRRGVDMVSGRRLESLEGWLGCRLRR